MNDGFESRVAMPDFDGFEKPAGVPVALLLRHGIDAKYRGGANIRKEAAEAKRTATALAKVVKSFEYLPDRQKEVFSKASGEMRGLAATLTKFAAWADEYKAFSDKRRQDEETAKAEAFAAQRWGNDQRAHELDAAVLCELNSAPGREDFVAWMQAQGLHQGVRAKGVDFEPDGSFHDAQLHKPGPTLRLRAAKFLMNMRPRESVYGDSVTLGRGLLDHYIKYRRSIDELTRRAVEKAST